VVVGRAADVDLRVAHSAMAHKQFAIERIATDGAPRFRIVPLGGRNPTFVHGERAVEGSIAPGEAIAVGPLRFAIGQARRAGGAPAKLRLMLLGGVVAVGVVALSLGSSTQKAGPEAAGGLDAPLFHPLPALACPTADGCAARARELYARARHYEELAPADGGNWYRAAVTFAYAAQLRLASGLPLAEIADARERVDRAAKKAQTLVDDARFQLQRAIKAGDGPRTMAALETLATLVPEQQHPIRIAIEMTRRDLVNNKTEEKK
jgi:hypothetical protein